MLYYEHGGRPAGCPEILYDFSQNVNPLGMPLPAREALRSSAAGSVFYPDPECTELRSLLANKYAISPESILCGNGASDLIFRICACLHPRNALIPEPAFSEYERCVRLFGGEVRKFFLKKNHDFIPDDMILAELTPETDFLFLGHPNNPTGALMPEPLLGQVLSLCAERNITVLVDECFLEFTDGKSALSYCGSFPNVMILNAFTKFYGMAGLRLGCLMGEKKLLQKIGEYGPAWSVSYPAQKAGAAALSCEPEWTGQTKKLITKEKEYLTGQLIRLGFRVYPGEADFLLVESRLPKKYGSLPQKGCKFPQTEVRPALSESLQKQGILLRDCSNFPGLDDHFLRIGIKSHDWNVRLIEALESAVRNSV